MASITKYQGVRGTRYKAVIRRKGYATLTKTFRTSKLAHDWAKEQEDAIEAGKASRNANARKKTLGDLIDAYLLSDEVKEQRDPSKAQRLGWWRDRIGKRKLVEITPDVLKDLRQTLRAEPNRKKRKRSPATVNRYVAALSGCLRWGHKEAGWIPSNPAREISRAKESRGRTRWLKDAEERQRLLDECRAEDAYPWLYPFVVIALGTGARRGELMALRWPDVDLKRGEAYLQTTKNDEPRVLSLLAPVVEALRNWKKEQKIRRLNNDRVFPIGRYELDYPWKRALERAGIEDFRFHDLRHSCASYLVQAGVPQRVVMEALGHKTLAASQRYLHLDTSTVRAALDKAMEGKL